MSSVNVMMSSAMMSSVMMSSVSVFCHPSVVMISPVSVVMMSSVSVFCDDVITGSRWPHLSGGFLSRVQTCTRLSDSDCRGIYTQSCK